MNDHPHLVGKRGVVAHTVGNGVGQNLAVTVFVLQAFAVERGAARCAAQQKAARLHVARRPGQVANALEAKHRVINIERHHHPVVGAVAGGRCNPARHAARFVNALLQNLARLVFAVVHHLLFVHRRVQLAFGVVNANLAEQALHTKGAGLIHQNRHHTGAQRFVAQQLRQKAHIGLGGRNFAAFGRGLQHRLEGVQRGHHKLLGGFGTALGQIATQGFAALMQVFHLGRVVGRLVKRHLGQLAVGNRNIEAIAHVANVVFAEFFGLVGGVFAFTRLAHAIALDRLDQQHRGLAGGVVVRTVEGGIHLGRIVATTAQGPNLVVAHFGHHLQQLWVAAKEVFAHKRAVVGFKGLIVTIQGVHHDFAQRAVFVFLQEWVPVAAPQQLDDVPARATEFALQLLDDLAVATHRAV